MISEHAIEEIDSVLYGKLEGRKPIRAVNYGGKHMTWFPKANEGQPFTDADREEAVKYGVWGGSVEGYGRGFNQQKCWLHFVGVDIDHKKEENATWTPPELKAAVLRAASGVASVRTSSSGGGYHLFMHVDPIECENKMSAQRLATQLGEKYLLPQLNAARIDVDKVACNQLWVLGGKQTWLSYASKIKLSDADRIVQPSTRALTASPCEVDMSQCGPVAREFLNLLAKTGAATPLTHLTLIKRALAGTEWAGAVEPWASGDNFDEPNCSVGVIGGTLRIYSFRHEKTLLSMPVGI